MPRRGSPMMNRRAASRLSFQPGRRSPRSAARDTSSSAATASLRAALDVGHVGVGVVLVGGTREACHGSRSKFSRAGARGRGRLGGTDRIEDGEWKVVVVPSVLGRTLADPHAGDLLLLPLHRRPGDDAGVEVDDDDVAAVTGFWMRAVTPPSITAPRFPPAVRETEDAPGLDRGFVQSVEDSR